MKGLYIDQIQSDLREATIALSDQIKSISYVKAHASSILRELAEHGQPLIITQNGEAKAVLQDVHSFEETQETMALLKILALGNRQIEDGRVRPASQALDEVRARRRSNV